MLPTALNGSQYESFSISAKNHLRFINLRIIILCKQIMKVVAMLLVSSTAVLATYENIYNINYSDEVEKPTVQSSFPSVELPMVSKTQTTTPTTSDVSIDPLSTYTITTAADFENLQTHLHNPNNTTVVVALTDSSYERILSNIEIPQGKTLKLVSGYGSQREDGVQLVVIIGYGIDLVNDGTLVIGREVLLGSQFSDGIIFNYGTIIRNSIHNSYIINYGTIINSKTSQRSTMFRKGNLRHP